jgi:cation transport regulator ChaC
MGSLRLTRESILDGSLIWNPAFHFAERRTARIYGFHRKRYVPGLDDEVIARYLATGAGPMGRCCDYLFDTVAHLRQLGIRDRRLESLEARVREWGLDT